MTMDHNSPLHEVWECEICGEGYCTEAEALACEEECRAKTPGQQESAGSFAEATVSHALALNQNNSKHDENENDSDSSDDMPIFEIESIRPNPISRATCLVQEQRPTGSPRRSRDIEELNHSQSQELPLNDPEKMSLKEGRSHNMEEVNLSESSALTLNDPEKHSWTEGRRSGTEESNPTESLALPLDDPEKPSFSQGTQNNNRVEATQASLPSQQNDSPVTNPSNLNDNTTVPCQDSTQSPNSTAATNTEETINTQQPSPNKDLNQSSFRKRRRKRHNCGDEQVDRMQAKFLKYLDEEIYASEEALFLNYLDDYIQQQEEKEFLDWLDAKISAEEELERIRKSQTFVLDFEEEQDWDFVDPRKKQTETSTKPKYSQSSKARVLEWEGACLKKLIPGTIQGIQFYDHTVFQKLKEQLLKAGCFNAQVKEMNGDFFLIIWPGLAEISSCKTLVLQFLRMLHGGYCVSFLKEYGVDGFLDIDPNEKLGAHLHDMPAHLLLQPSSAESLIPQLKEWFHFGAVLVLNVDGNPCRKTSEFFQRKQACIAARRRFIIHVLRFDADVKRQKGNKRVALDVQTSQLQGESTGPSESAQSNQIQEQESLLDMDEQEQLQFQPISNFCEEEVPQVETVSKKTLSTPKEARLSPNSKRTRKRSQKIDLQFSQIIHTDESLDLPPFENVTSKRPRVTNDSSTRDLQFGTENPHVSTRESRDNSQSDGHRDFAPQTVAVDGQIFRSGSIARMEATQGNIAVSEWELKRQRAEYEVVFKTTEPMGFYFVNEVGPEGISSCKVKSVCPKTSALRDSRIQKGTTVVAAAGKYGRTPIHRWEKLRDCFFQAKDSKEELCVIFINLQSTAGEDVGEQSRYQRAIRAVAFNDEWNSAGKWRGFAGHGWAGNAGHVRKIVQRKGSRQCPSAEPETDNAQPFSNEVCSTSTLQLLGDPDQLDPQEDTSDIQKFEDERQEIEELFMVTSVRPLLKTKPKPIRLVNTSQAGKEKEVSFSPEDEERHFYLDAPSKQFYVDRSQAMSYNLPLGDDSIYRAIVSGSISDVVELLEHGSADALSMEDFRNLLESMKKDITPDYLKKDVILKIFINAIDIFRQTNALNDWVGFQVELQSFHSKVSMENLEQDCEEIVAELKLNKFPNIQETLLEVHIATKDCSSFTFSSAPPIHVRHNKHTESLRVLEFQMKKLTSSGEWESLGFASIELNSLYNESLANEKRLFTRTCVLSSLTQALQESTLTILVKQSSQSDMLPFKKAKRRDYCSKLNYWIGQIKEFNMGMAEGLPLLETPILGGSTLGSTFLHSAVMLAEMPIVLKLKECGALLSRATLNLVEIDPKDGYHGARKEIATILKIWPSKLPEKEAFFLPNNTDSIEENESLAIEEMNRYGRDWLCQVVERGKKYQTRCPDFESGYCKQSKMCPFGHVYKAHQVQVVPTKFDIDHVVVIADEDQFGQEWYTSGYIDGNEFFYAHGCDGEENKKTGIWWYLTEDSAINAARFAVVGRDN